MFIEYETSAEFSPQMLKDASCFVLVYAVNSKDSLTNVLKRFADLRERAKTSLPAVLIGNKNDADIGGSDSSSEIEVPARMASVLAQGVTIDINSDHIVRISAKDNINIDDMINKILKATKIPLQTKRASLNKPPKKDQPLRRITLAILGDKTYVFVF